MGFHLGSNQFKINLGGQTYKVRVETSKSNIEPDIPIIEPEEYTLAIYWRVGIKDVIVTRNSTQYSHALLTRLYNGAKIYTGDVLTIEVITVTSDIVVQPYVSQYTVTGDTTVFIEPVDEIFTSKAQEICLPSGMILQAAPAGSSGYVGITADFNIEALWTSYHWGGSFEIDYLTAQTPIDIYKLDVENDDWVYAGNTLSEDLTSIQQAQYIQERGKYLGSLWIDGDSATNKLLWYITYRTVPPLNIISPFEELTLTSDYAIGVTRYAAGFADNTNFERFVFTADFSAHFICGGCHWGSWVIDASYPTVEQPIDIYELETYDNQNYQEIIGEGMAEGEYIAANGTYLGSIYPDSDGIWHVIYKETK